MEGIKVIMAALAGVFLPTGFHTKPCKAKSLTT